MVDETWTAKLYPSLKMLAEGRSSHARAVKDVTLQDTTGSTKRPSEAQKNEMIQEKLIREDYSPAHRETAHSRQGQKRLRCQDGEGGRRSERR